MYNDLNKSQRFTFIFDSGVPGTDRATEALDFAHDAGIDIVFNYSAVNSETAAIDSYLAYAAEKNVRVGVSFKDFYGDKDLDPDPGNQAIHNFYGSTNIERVTKLTQAFEASPAGNGIWGYFLADEPEGVDPDASAADIAAKVKIQHDIVKSITSKPTLSAHWRLPSVDLQTLAQGSDNLMMNYHPYPDGPNQTYGPVEDIESVARDTAAAAGDNSWFNLQAFSYYVNEPYKIEPFGFPSSPPDSNQGAPDTQQMVDMAKRALKGGVCHLGFFSYGYAKQVGDHQLANLKEAIRIIHELPEYRLGCPR